MNDLQSLGMGIGQRIQCFSEDDRFFIAVGVKKSHARCRLIQRMSQPICSSAATANANKHCAIRIRERRGMLTQA